MSTSPNADSSPQPRPARWKRWLKWTTVSLVVVIACLFLIVKDDIRTLRSLRRVPNTKLYVMDYYADYNMDEIREDGVDMANIDESFLATFFPDFVLPIARRVGEAYVPDAVDTLPDANADHCSTGVVRTASGEVLFGRNFDWRHDACLIVKIHGGDAASSVALIDLAYLNLDRDDLDQTGLLERIPLLFAPYYVGDGMNQYGVAVSEMSVANVQAPRDATKPDIISSTATRLMLDYARTTDEAIAILKDYNIHFVETTGHLLIADAQADFAVVEFIDGDLKVTRPEQPWQACTNHRIWGKTEADNDETCGRYRTVSDRLEALDGSATAGDIMDTMAMASIEGWTMWTSVYNLSTGEFQVAYRRQYADVHTDQLTTP